MRRISVQWILIVTTVALCAMELPAQVDDTTDPGVVIVFVISAKVVFGTVFIQ